MSEEEVKAQDEAVSAEEAQPESKLADPPVEAAAEEAAPAEEEAAAAEEEVPEKAPAAEEKPTEASEGMLRGISFDDQHTFLVPKMWGPLDLDVRHYTLLDWASKLCIVNLLIPFLRLPNSVMIAYFMFWRFGYNLGIGLMLHFQSKNQWMTRLAERVMKMPKDSWQYRLLRYASSTGMKNYDFDNTEPCVNAWVAFRRFEDIVLPYDLMAYIGFALSNFNAPANWGILTILEYALGVFLCIFALWAKSDSYRVVKDFAWYYGDFFFLVKGDLSFDRVFKIAPHPMYTIGYAFFYGSAILTRSYVVLYVSVVGHLMQLGFLALFETPHMKKIYPEMLGDEEERKRNSILYDSNTGYFSKDLLGWHNFNALRFSDVATAVLAGQMLLFYMFLPNNSSCDKLVVSQALIWRIAHNGVLGFILYKQSVSNWWVKSFIDHGKTEREAFDHWKSLYNLVHTMTWVSFALGCWHLGHVSTDRYFVPQTVGLLLILICAASWISSYEVLGDFGWFYGDFFIHDEKLSSKLVYKGVYRFMDNPDSIIGYAAFYGIAIFFECKTMIFVGIFSQLCQILFVVLVERPHMRRVHGDKIRSESGIESAFQEIIDDVLKENPSLKSRVDEFKQTVTKKINETFKGEAVQKKMRSLLDKWGDKHDSSESTKAKSE